MILKCECCGFEREFATTDEAFDAGWDEKEHLPNWPVSCDLCPGVCAMGEVDHSEAHAIWERNGRPAEFSLEGLPSLPEDDAEKTRDLLLRIFAV
jgi:hypothetical protein